MQIAEAGFGVGVLTKVDSDVSKCRIYRQGQEAAVAGVEADFQERGSAGDVKRKVPPLSPKGRLGLFRQWMLLVQREQIAFDRLT